MFASQCFFLFFNFYYFNIRLIIFSAILNCCSDTEFRRFIETVFLNRIQLTKVYIYSKQKLTNDSSTSYERVDKEEYYAHSRIAFLSLVLITNSVIRFIPSYTCRAGTKKCLCVIFILWSVTLPISKMSMTF